MEFTILAAVIRSFRYPPAGKRTADQTEDRLVSEHDEYVEQGQDDKDFEIAEVPVGNVAA